MQEEIMVSVICTTYNHEKYIGQCLENMVNQKTNFKYEIIVHDDASTDSTASIIMRMQKEYPDILKPILQKENQLSQGCVSADIGVKEARGKYLAFCEGDDYWCDDEKLQKQYDYMESHEDCSFCFHDTYTYYVSKDILEEGWYYWKGSQFNGAGIYTIDDMLKLQKAPYGSLFYRRSDYVYKDELGEFCNKITYSDILNVMCLADKGYGYCLPGHLSVYRYATSDSFSAKWESGVTGYNLSLEDNMNTWGAFDYYTKSSYKDFVEERLKETVERKIELLEDDIEVISQESDKVYIYGTGVYGAICLAEMKKMNVNIEGFVVSDEIEKEDSYYEKPVYYLSEIIDGDAGVIVAVGRNIRAKIIENIKENSAINKYCIGLQEID